MRETRRTYVRALLSQASTCGSGVKRSLMHAKEGPACDLAREITITAAPLLRFLHGASQEIVKGPRRRIHQTSLDAHRSGAQGLASRHPDFARWDGDRTSASITPPALSRDPGQPLELRLRAPSLGFPYRDSWFDRRVGRAECKLRLSAKQNHIHRRHLMRWNLEARKKLTRSSGTDQRPGDKVNIIHYTNYNIR